MKSKQFTVKLVAIGTFWNVYVKNNCIGVLCHYTKEYLNLLAGNNYKLRIRATSEKSADFKLIVNPSNIIKMWNWLPLKQELGCHVNVFIGKTIDEFLFKKFGDGPVFISVTKVD